jgi:hypothetical protein
MRFLDPTTLAVSGSDLHRVYLTRLCCAFRLSQPLDALFRPSPLRPSFMPITPLGFSLQRFSPSGSRHVSRRALSSMLFLRCASAPTRGRHFATSAAAPRIDASGGSVSSHASVSLAMGDRSSPGSLPLRGISPRLSASCFHAASSHGLLHSAWWQATKLRVRSSESQRTRAWTISRKRLSSPPEVSALSAPTEVSAGSDTR